MVMQCGIARSLLQLREAAGLSRRQVAERMEVSLSLVSAWETGHREPSLDQAGRLAEMYATTVEAIAAPSPCDHEPQTYSPAETAIIFGVSLSSIYRAIKRGEIRAVSLGDRKIIPREEIDRLLGR